MLATIYEGCSSDNVSHIVPLPHRKITRYEPENEVLFSIWEIFMERKIKLKIENPERHTPGPCFQR